MSTFVPDTFRLEITLGNAAMWGSGDVAAALHDVAASLGRQREGGKVVDVNGNIVGSYGYSRATVADDDGDDGEGGEWGDG